MGIGVLIVFIALLLVAAVAAGVLMTTGTNLQERGLSTGSQAKKQVSTNVRIMEISGRNGIDGDLETIESLYKLAAGSDPIRLDEMVYMEATDNSSNIMRWKRNGYCINDVFNGYFTAGGDDSEFITSEFRDPIHPSFEFSSTQTSEMMIGKIAVAVVYVESDGSVDTNEENWTSVEKDYMYEYIEEGLNWWHQVEPRAHMRFSVEKYHVTTSYEPIRRDTTLANQTLWVSEALDQIGADPGASILSRARSFDEKLRKRQNAHWAFIIFAVDSSHFGPCFPDGTAGIAWINGPFTMIASDCYGNLEGGLVAHEVGHIFGAYDQYRSSGCACSNRSGYYGVRTENCNAVGGCLTNVTSIMGNFASIAQAWPQHAVDMHARAQMGLIDTNDNNIMDPIDQLYGTTDDNILINDEAVVNESSKDYEYEYDRIDTIGFFVTEYSNKGGGQVDGALTRGDVLKVCHELARPIEGTDHLKLSILPKHGQEHVSDFIVTDVINKDRTYLYP
jgi:archaellin